MKAVPFKTKKPPNRKIRQSFASLLWKQNKSKIQSDFNCDNGRTGQKLFALGGVGIYWIDLALDRDKWWDLADTVVNFGLHLLTS